MLDKALHFTSTALNQFLKNTFSLNEDKVVMNNLISPNGDIPDENKNKIVLSLLNIEQETNKQFYGRNQQLNNGSYVNVNPSERFNLDLLFSSNFQDYTETLKFLNATIQFFQANSTIDRTKYSNLPADIDRLNFDIEKITYHEMHSLWSAMGAKYQPSVIYKLRLITIQAEETIQTIPYVQGIDNKAAVK
ncbi:MAG: DUF4255 domain-containing protein [Crocinitomix sp.]|nr:DUF4255 domain-containing protein [Crocinitomix sp.]